MRRKKVYIVYDDPKVMMWANASKEDVEIIGLTGNYFLYPIKLLGIKKGDAFILRYLNDKKNLFLEIANIITLLYLVLFVRLRGAKLGWICHNVDQETHIYHTRINRIKRELIKKSSKKIYVTNILLKNRLSKIENIPLDKISVASYGAIGLDEARLLERSYFYSDKNLSKFVPRFTKKIVIFSISNYASKIIKGVELFMELAKEANRACLPCEFLLAGGQVRGIHYQNAELYKEISSLDNVTLYDGPLSIFVLSEYAKSQNISLLYVKDYEDLSMPLSLYLSAQLQIPMLTSSSGFLGEVVKYYELGWVVDPDKTDVSSIVNSMNVKAHKFENFLSENNWRSGAEKLASI